MPILALKPFEFRRVKYAAGDPLPEEILRSVDLREYQRGGYVSADANMAMARAPAAPAAALPEAPAWLLDAPAKPAKGARGRR